MTAREALADARLSDALELQRQAVADAPDDPVARLFLFELLALTGDRQAAADQLNQIPSTDPDWPATRRAFRRLLRAEARRSPDLSRPRFLLPPPAHVKRRWNAARANKHADPDRATAWLDRADATASTVRGYVDGREFDALRDTDDRFATVFEVFVGGRYVWLPFEQVRVLRLHPAAAVLDVAFRPGEVRLADGREVPVVVPLLYPGSAAEGDDFALGEVADWTSADAGLVCGLGAKVLSFGDDDHPLAGCRMIELRG
jgi:type VI secretion system protein ImpE